MTEQQKAVQRGLPYNYGRALSLSMSMQACKNMRAAWPQPNVFWQQPVLAELAEQGSACCHTAVLQACQALQQQRQQAGRSARLKSSQRKAVKVGRQLAGCRHTTAADVSQTFTNVAADKHIVFAYMQQAWGSACTHLVCGAQHGHVPQALLHNRPSTPVRG